MHLECWKTFGVHFLRGEVEKMLYIVDYDCGFIVKWIKKKSLNIKVLLKKK